MVYQMLSPVVIPLSAKEIILLICFKVIIRLSMGAITFVVLFAAVWIQVTLEDVSKAMKGFVFSR